MSELKQGFIVETPEGLKVFETKSEAKEFIRTPLVLKALKVLSKDADTAAWLLEHKEDILSAFEGGKLRRVTKSERKSLEKALDAVTTGFLHNYAAEILESFKWPTQSRVKKEDQAAEVQTQLMSLTDENVEMTKWLTEHQDALTAAYETGIEKREVSPKATAALEAYRAMTPEQRVEYAAKKAAEKAAEAEAKTAAAKAA